jgi:hypothetical protein
MALVVSFLFCKTQVLNFSTFEIEKLGLGRLCKRSLLQNNEIRSNSKNIRIKG